MSAHKIDAKRVVQAIMSHEREQRFSWVRARAAMRIVGLRDGKTGQLARACSVSQARVRDWAKAYVFFEQLAYTLRKLPDQVRHILPYTARSLRDKLTLDHFVQLGIALRVEEIPVMLAYEIMCEAAEEGVGAKLTREKLEALYADSVSDSWRVGWRRFERFAQQHADSIETPLDLRLATRAYLRRVRRILARMV